VNDADRVDELLTFAQGLGIETEYWDTRGAHHVSSIDALLAVLRSLGHELDGLDGLDAARAAHEERLAAWSTDPVLVAWQGQPFSFELRLPASHAVGSITLAVELEGGGEVSLGSIDLASVPVRGEHDAGGSFRVRRIELPPVPVPAGYHELALSGPPVGAVWRRLFVAPPTMPGFGRDERLWGAFAPVYSLAGGSGLGAHVGSLASFAQAIDGFGGKIAGTLPLLAAWLGEPFDPSPYAPVSRRFWNELFVDLAALPELAHSVKAGANLDGLRSIGHCANEKTRTFDYRHQYGFVRGVLEEVVADSDQWPDALWEAFTRASSKGDVSDYAMFRAFAEQQGCGWRDWPARQRSGRIERGDVDPAVVRFHEFGQYAMQRDLERLDADLRTRGQHLYLDLPVGAHGAGYDTWKHRDRFVEGMSAGAPPDDFFAEGQSWGFPPLSPWTSRLDGHQHFRDVLAHHMAVTGILRLDHVMGLHRLFWVPDGMSAKEGVYVRYPREELFAVLAIEAHRHDCIVIGEDLGTVPEQIRDAMGRHDLLGMYVAEFNQPSWPGAPLAGPQREHLASVDTHDTPTFAGWVHGLDIDRRHVQGMLGDADAERERAERRTQVRNLTEFLVARGDIADGYRSKGEPDEHVLLEGLLRFLGDSDAPAVLVALDDLVGERNPQNVPGTLVDRPNWVQRFPIPVERLATDDGVAAHLQALQGCRLGSHLRVKADA
jgi:4-alpha-glucanotransferase